MEKILLIDGHNLLFQMFYGMPSVIYGREGKPIQAVIGFVGAVNKLIRLVEPTYLAVFFDREQPNLRAEILGDYKANREDFSQASDEDNPFFQLPDIYRALDCMGIAHREIETYEADDAFSACCLAYGGEYEIYISSFDSDLYQLLSPNVRILRYRGKLTTVMDEKAFAEKFGIAPGQYAHWKALVGDHADNIRGVDGVGPKTAAALLCQYGTLQGIHTHLSEIPRERLRSRLTKDWETVERNFSLIKLDDRCPVPFTPGQMRFSPKYFKTTDVLREIGAL